MAVTAVVAAVDDRPLPMDDDGAAVGGADDGGAVAAAAAVAGDEDYRLASRSK